MNPLRAGLLAASGNPGVRRFVSRYGMRLGAGRFVAGETAAEFLRVARRLNGEGFAVAASILGEGVTSRLEAQEAAAQYVALLARIRDEGLDANVALKLTHLGLDLDEDFAARNAQTVLDAAQETRNSVRFDMEQSAYVDATLRIYRQLRARYDNVGFVLQSCLYRTLDDLRGLIALRPNVRIVKGAYLEPVSVAFARKSEVDENYRRLVDCAFAAQGYTAIATHDARLMRYAIAAAQRKNLPRLGRFEFQLLLGVRPDLARWLRDCGYRVRVAVPFGRFWFPYLMRRLAERPANVGFVLKSLVQR